MKRPIFWVSLGENTVTVAVFVVFTYNENKLFLRCFFAWPSGRKNIGSEERKRSVNRTLTVWSCVRVHASGRKRERNSKGGTIERV